MPREYFKPGKNRCTPPDSEERRRQKLRESWVKRRETYVHPMLGKKHSELACQHMRVHKRSGNGRRGKKHTLETRAKISQVVRERTPRGKRCHSYKDGKLAVINTITSPKRAFMSHG
jgi:NUMOD3 motif